MKRLHRAALASAAFAVAFATGSWAQDPPDSEAQSETITFSAPAERISVLLAQLSRQTGLKLSADSPVADEVMVLQVKDVQKQDLLKRIADAAGATWSIQNGRYRLTRPSEVSVPQVKAEIATRAAALKKALEPYVKALDKPADAASTAQDSAGMSSMVVSSSSGPGGQVTRTFSSQPTGPGANAITRLIQQIGVDTIAALPFDARTVFATPANRSQQALPFGAGQVVTKYIQEARASEAPVETQPNPGPGRRPRRAITGAGGNLDLTPAKAVLIVTRMGFGDGLTFELIVADAEGRLVSRASLLLVPAPAAKDVADVTVDSGGEPLELPSRAAQFAKLIQTGSGAAGDGTQRIAVVRMVTGDAPDDTMVLEPDAGKTPTVDKDWRARLINPEVNEPLGFCAGPALGKVADAAELNIVAVLPDSALVPAARTVAGGASTVGATLAAAQTDWGLKATKEGKWLVLRPRKQASSYACRLNRALLGKTLRQLSTAGLLTLDDRATYAAGQPIAPSGANFENEYFRLISASEGSRMATGLLSGERKMLRFYAALNGLQKQALGSGKSLSIASLGFSQRDILADMVFNSTDGPAGGGGPVAGGRRQLQAQRMMTGGDLTTERTEMLPDGIPNGGALTVQTGERPTIFGIAPSGEKIAIGGPTIVFAANGIQAPAAAPTQYDTYVVGRRFTYAFLFQLLPNVAFRRTLTDVAFDPIAKPVPYAQLPEDLRRRVEQAQNGVIRLNIDQTQSTGPVRP